MVFARQRPDPANASCVKLCELPFIALAYTHSPPGERGKRVAEGGVRSEGEGVCGVSESERRGWRVREREKERERV